MKARRLAAATRFARIQLTRGQRPGGGARGAGGLPLYCATANPTQLIVAQTELGRGVLGVVDGASPLGVETDADIAWRKDLLRQIGYKL